MMTSTKPYITRAFYEWILDNGLTPYLVIHTDNSSGLLSIPQQFFDEEQMVFNVSPSATEQLQMNNDGVSFRARFAGVPNEVYVPTENVMAIYAKENGKGVFFEESPGAGSQQQSPQSSIKPAPKAPKIVTQDKDKVTTKPASKRKKTTSDKSFLRVVK